MSWFPDSMKTAVKRDSQCDLQIQRIIRMLNANCAHSACPKSTTGSVRLIFNSMVRAAPFGAPGDDDGTVRPGALLK